MKDFIDLYENLNGSESKIIETLANEYVEYLNERNIDTLEELKLKRENFDAELKNIINKKFLIVYGDINTNERLVRRYRSSQYIETKPLEKVAHYLTLRRPEKDIFFMTMSEKAYEKMTLDEDLRTLPGCPSTILELDATKRGRSGDEDVTYILGPDAAKVAKLLGMENPEVSCYESYKVDKTKAPAVNQTAINLPLFYCDGRSKTYKECVDEGRLMVITRGHNTATRSLANSLLWENSGIIQSKFEKLKRWTSSEAFNKKLCFIKVGDYRRIQKFIKDEAELPTWDEYLRKLFRKSPELITQLFHLGIQKKVEFATSIFDTPSSTYYDTAVEVAEKYYNNDLSEKQKTFVDDLRTCYQVRSRSGNYDAAALAENLNNHFALGVEDPRNNASNIIKLGLETKYPWIRVINQYRADEEDCMKEIFEIVERY